MYRFWSSINLSSDVSVIQWIMSCHKNRMTTRYITYLREQVTSWRGPCQPCIFCWPSVNFKGDKIQFKVFYDKQNLTLMVISYEISETCQRLFSYILYEMTTHVRSSLYADISSIVSPWFIHMVIVLIELYFPTECEIRVRCVINRSAVILHKKQNTDCDSHSQIQQTKDTGCHTSKCKLSSSSINPYKPSVPKKETLANSVDPDQMLHNALSDQGLHCLH